MRWIVKGMSAESRWVRRLVAAGLVTAIAGVSLTYLTAARATSASVSTPRCRTGALEVWLGIGGGGGQTGGTAYPMEFTNVSSHRCHLYGYPGVSALRNGGQIGSAAQRNAAVAPTTVTLSPGATAHTMLQITDVSALPNCKPVTADELQVYPPGAFSAAEIPFRFKACSATGPRFLSVEVVQKRVGVRGHL
jgi:hypothetical protein